MSNIRPGMLLKKGDPLFTVENSRFGDRESVSQYNTLLSQADALQGEILGAKNTVGQEAITLEKDQRLYDMGAHRAHRSARVAEALRQRQRASSKPRRTSSPRPR